MINSRERDFTKQVKTSSFLEALLNKPNTQAPQSNLEITSNTKIPKMMIST